MDPAIETLVPVAATSPYLVFVYVTYAVVSIGLTIWLARTLGRNGEVFLRDVFEDKPDLAGAVNQLLVVGFYLVNLGYAALIMRADPAGTAIAAIETLASKLGLLLMSLAVMHFANMYVFHRIRRRSLDAPILGGPYRSFEPAPQGPALAAGDQHSAFAMIAERRGEAAVEAPAPVS
jgi:hypothetical protein